jgi:hypothetical protein
MNNYQKQALEFLENTNSQMKIEYLKNDYHFQGDKEKRDIYKITLKRGNREYVFNFGQSLINSLKYQDDLKKESTYTPNGKRLTGNYSVTEKYIKEFCKPIKGEKPTEYEILASLTKNNPGTLEDFCNEYGYNDDSKKAESIYNAVKEEYFSIATLYNEKEMEELQGIS